MIVFQLGTQSGFPDRDLDETAAWVARQYGLPLAQVVVHSIEREHVDASDLSDADTRYLLSGATIRGFIHVPGDTPSPHADHHEHDDPGPITVAPAAGQTWRQPAASKRGQADAQPPRPSTRRSTMPLVRDDHQLPDVPRRTGSRRAALLVIAALIATGLIAIAASYFGRADEADADRAQTTEAAPAELDLTDVEPIAARYLRYCGHRDGVLQADGRWYDFDREAVRDRDPGHHHLVDVFVFSPAQGRIVKVANDLKFLCPKHHETRGLGA